MRNLLKKVFKGQTTPESTLKEIEKKNEKIKKLKEEINNMAKLVIRDGKLVEDKPTINVTPVQAHAQPQVQQVQPQTQQYQQPQQTYEQPVQQEQMGFPEEIETVPVQPQPVQRPVPQTTEVLPITILLTMGQSLKVDVPMSEIELFIKAINEAIVNQSVFTLSNQCINAKHILLYSF